MITVFHSICTEWSQATTEATSRRNEWLIKNDCQYKESCQLVLWKYIYISNITNVWKAMQPLRIAFIPNRYTYPETVRKQQASQVINPASKNVVVVICASHWGQVISTGVVPKFLGINGSLTMKVLAIAGSSPSFVWAVKRSKRSSIKTK